MRCRDLFLIFCVALSTANGPAGAAAAAAGLSGNKQLNARAAAADPAPSSHPAAGLDAATSTIMPQQVIGAKAAGSSAGQRVLRPPPAAAALHAADPKAGVKPLWPLDGKDLALLAIIMFSLSLAGGAGIGGGAILVPVYLMLRGWPTAIAVALSNVTILGGSFANFICNVTRHRPNGKRTIDWELILMMEPTTIAGALVGAVANKILPNWITTYLLAIVLTLMALRLYTKARQTYTKESQLLESAKAAAKERRVERQRTTSSINGARSRDSYRAEADAPASQRLETVPSGGVAVPVAAGRALRKSASVTASINQSFSRSMSRLRGTLVVASSLASPSPSFTAGGVTPSGGSLLSGRTAQDAAEGAGGQEAQLPAPALEQYLRGTLFQGDVGDEFEPVVALPHSDDLSSHTSSDDLEYGDIEHADVPDLQQPLLPKRGGVSPTPSADDLQHEHDQTTDKAAAAGAGRKERPTEEAPDLTIHLGAPEAVPKPPVPESSLPWPHFLTLVGLSAWVVGADIAQDSFRCGSWQYWASQLSVLIPVVAILMACRQVLLSKYHHDDLPPGTQPPEGELHWTRRTTILYPLLCSSAGLIAGLFGIGGGVVKGPLMLELGVPADVAAATSATMIMFTAGSACLVYSRFGQILYDYAVVLMLLGFFITLGSQLLTFVLIKLLGRRSIIIFMMVALMAAATCIMYVQSGLVTADLVAHPDDLWKFGSICPALKTGNIFKQLGMAILQRLQ